LVYETARHPYAQTRNLLVTTLDLLNEGQKARILDVSGEDAIAIRLMEMGLTDGEQVEHLGCAPLGDPIEFLIRGYRLSLRSTEASRVIVERIV
jgi:ferrous iron transport protein A